MRSADAAPRNRLMWGVLCSILLVALTVGMRAYSAPFNEPLSHDDSISVMHAAGKSGDYADMTAENRPPIGTWTTVAEWKSFMTPDGLDVAGVLDSTRRADLHPPAYFVLVNAWQAIFGPSRDAGWQVNAAISSLSVLFVFLLCLRLTDEIVVSALSAAALALLPGAIQTSLAVRQYELLGMCTILLVWMVATYFEQHRPLRWAYVGLGTVCALGLLTHIYFVLPMGGAMAWIALKTLRWDFRRSLHAAAAMAAGLAAAVALNPDSFMVFGRTTRAGVDNTVALMASKAAAFVGTLLGGLGINGATAKGLFAAWGMVGVPTAFAKEATLVALAAVLVGLFFALRPAFGPLKEGASRLSIGVFFFLWLTFWVGAMYVIIPSLSPALGMRYLAMSWPMVAVCVALLAAPARRLRWLPIAGVLALLVLANVSAWSFTERLDPAPLRAARHVVIDNVARGVILPYVDIASADTEIYANWRGRLVSADNEWVDRLEPGDVVVLADLYQPESVPGDRLLEVVQDKWMVETIELKDLRGTAYRITGAAATTTESGSQS